MPAEVKVCHSHRWVLLTQKLDVIVVAPHKITVHAAAREFARKCAARHHRKRHAQRKREVHNCVRRLIRVKSKHEFRACQQPQR